MKTRCPRPLDDGDAAMNFEPGGSPSHRAGSVRGSAFQVNRLIIKVIKIIYLFPQQLYWNLTMVHGTSEIYSLDTVTDNVIK